MDFLANLGNLLWWFLSIFAFVAYLMALFAVLGDLFRDRELNGWWKALWVLFLLFVPFLTVLVYLIARGRGMAERQNQAARQQKDAVEDYIREAAGRSAIDEIARAKELYDAKAITKAEFDALKAKALA